ncbi:MULTISPECIES: hypothetical protein [Enterococcus]|jgi:hypothetical protein|uniref:Uncharacterized protein n=1 Tax=Enterococcus gallinarum TaxID=1353 RepID=A0A376H1H4_ENTGA|nr:MULTISPECIES: hypothetical protein [Enterococcus]EGO2662987.1 hypothetical protein [Enterococcus faecalis]EGO2825122.1 hypothetical protein [Enterococcus faecalis]EGO8419631.1 hypothetical protein [Enterococcus faecalis]EGS7862353.1 hypothetical protein [Enterococcus faecalis]EHH1656534.1 hypothetical protein [Enterococcus faecalis]
MYSMELAQKKYVKNKVRKAFIKANVTIPKIVINGMATALYKEFINLSIEEQERLLFSDELLPLLVQKHVERMEQEFIL